MVISHWPTFIICLLGCVYITYFELRSWYDWRQLNNSGATTTASITKIYPATKRTGTYLFVSYQFDVSNFDQHQKTFRGGQWVLKQDYLPLSLGESISIRYLKNKPSANAVEEDFRSRLYRTIPAMVCFGLLFFILTRTIQF